MNYSETKPQPATATIASSAAVLPMRRCDCGQPAYRRDGSGWFCRECEIVVSAAQRAIDEHIRKERAERQLAYMLTGDQTEPACKRDRKGYYKIYARMNRDAARARWRKWKNNQARTK